MSSYCTALSRPSDSSYTGETLRVLVRPFSSRAAPCSVSIVNCGQLSCSGLLSCSFPSSSLLFSFSCSFMFVYVAYGVRLFLLGLCTCATSRCLRYIALLVSQRYALCPTTSRENVTFPISTHVCNGELIRSREVTLVVCLESAPYHQHRR